MQRPKSNLFFEEKALSPKKSEESEELSSFTNVPHSKYFLFDFSKKDYKFQQIQNFFPRQKRFDSN